MTQHRSPDSLPETIGPGSSPAGEPVHDSTAPTLHASAPALASGTPEARPKRTVGLENLLEDRLLTSASRLSLNGRATPSLAGIPLIRKLGQGGMGAVYLGLHPRLEREVAVKVLPFHLMESQPQLVQRFLREARIAAKIQSPHLVNVYDVHEEGGLFFIVMEYVDGESAGQALKRARADGQPGLSEEDALAILAGATAGLAAAHAQGVVHRDVKPENILLPRAAGGEGFNLSSAKLADLGLARSDDTDQGLTGTQVVMGTLGYLAPEQAMDAKSVGPGADVFSMGATLYALLTGTPPFERQSAAKALMDTLHEPHVPLQDVRPGASESVCALVDRCLAKEPAERFPDAAALLDAIQTCRAGGTLPLTLPGLKRPRKPAPAGFWTRWGKYLLGAAGMLLLLLALGALTGRKENLRAQAAKALADGDYKAAKAVLTRYLEAEPRDAEALKNLAAADAGLAAEDFFAKARAALERKDYEEAEAQLEALEWLRRGGEPVLGTFPALAEKLTKLRMQAGREAAAHFAGAVPAAGSYGFNDEQEASYRWAKGLQRRAGLPDAEERALDAKLPELFRAELPPESNILLEAPNFLDAERRMLKLGARSFFEQFPGQAGGALDWSKPLVGVARAPGIWDIGRENWKWGVRFQITPGQERPLKALVDLLAGWATLFKPGAFQTDTEGVRWIVTNGSGWKTLLEALPKDDAAAAQRRKHGDLFLCVRGREWIRDNLAVIRATRPDAPADERANLELASNLSADLGGLALKIHARTDALWIRARLYAEPGTVLAGKLKGDSRILWPDRWTALPKETTLAAAACPQEPLFPAFFESFLAKLALQDAQPPGRKRAEAARNEIVRIARQALKAAGPHLVAGFAPGGRRGADCILGAADLKDPGLNPLEISAEVQNLITSLYRFDRLSKGEDPASVPDTPLLTPLPEVEFQGRPIVGLHSADNTLEVRWTVQAGRLCFAVGPQGHALLMLQESVDRVVNGKGESLAAQGWFKSATAKASRQFGIVALYRPPETNLPHGLALFARSLDGFFEANLRIPGPLLKDVQEQLPKPKR
ncbi:MAG: protein kinase [Planctomycetota bacterium]|nr:protein kinase [Planctomycetota bacterium]